MMGISLAMNAWREILARVFVDAACEDNASPEWLVNPATKRSLKLDKYYPELGVAVRFVGLTARGQKRQSDWEVMETEQRDETREELCRLNGVQLALIEPYSDDVVKQIDTLARAIALAKLDKTGARSHGRPNSQRIRSLERAWSAANELRSRLARSPQQVFASLGEAWRDRETNAIAAASLPPLPPSRMQTLHLHLGQAVHHERFGAGEVIALTGVGDDQQVAIRFGDGHERTFLVALVRGKLAPATSVAA